MKKKKILPLKIKAAIILLTTLLLITPTTNILPTTHAEPTNQQPPTPNPPQNNHQTTTQQPQTTDNPREQQQTLIYNPQQSIQAGICTANQPVEQIIITQAYAGEHGEPCQASNIENVACARGTLSASTMLTSTGGIAQGSLQGNLVESIYNSPCFPSEACGQSCADFLINAQPKQITFEANLYHSNYHAQSTARYGQPSGCGCLCEDGNTHAGVVSGFYADENTRVPLRMMVPFSIPQDGYLWIDPESFIQNHFPQSGSGWINMLVYLIPQEYCGSLCEPCDDEYQRQYLWQATLAPSDGTMVTLTPRMHTNMGIPGSGTTTRYQFVHRHENIYSGNYTLVVLFSPSVYIVTSARCNEAQQMTCDGRQSLSLTIHYSPLDLDIDSDNTKTDPDYPPDRDITEEDLEWRSEEPGRYILPNDDDDNQNSIIDLNDFMNTCEDDFVRMVFELPELVSVVKDAQTMNPTARIGFSYPSTIRLWKKNGDQPRTQNDIIRHASNYMYQVDEFEMHDERTIWLWVENIAPYQSTTLDYPEVIIAGIIPCEDDLFAELFHGYDSVRFTRLPSVYVDLDVDSDNNNRYFEPERDILEEAWEMKGNGKLIWAHHEPRPVESYTPPYSRFDLFPLERSIGPGSILDSSNFYHGADVTLSQKGGSGAVTIYAPPPDDDASQRLWTVVPLGSPLQQEYFSEGGLQRKWYIVGEEPGQVILELKLRKTTPYYAHPIIVTDTVKLTVLKIEEVKWVGTSISPLDENPNAGGGLRIFPDKNTPNDQPKGLVKRTVGVLVTINPPLPNIMVYLKYFDVDDPKESRIPVDDESKSHDNRQKQEVGFFTYTIRPPQSSITHDTDSSLHQIGGMPAEYRFFNTDSKPTNNFGRVYVSFIVSMQPGDNYRVVADLAEYEWINTLRVPQRTRYGEVHTRFGNNVSENQITELLTVWRRLWIERDVMISWQSLDEVTLSGTLLSITPNYGLPGYSAVTIKLRNGFDSDWADQLDCLEGGYLQITDEIRYPILKSRIDVEYTTVGLGAFPKEIGVPSKYILWLVIQGIPPTTLINKSVRVFDDDNLDILPQTPNGGSTLINAFAQAYVLPIYWDEWTDYIPFTMHLGSFWADMGIGFWDNYQDSRSTIDCWTVFIVSAWEFDKEEDADPDCVINMSFFTSHNLNPRISPPVPDDDTLGVTQSKWIYNNPIVNKKASAIFYQTIYDLVSRSRSSIFNFTVPHIAEHIITHEIGHHFSDSHEPSTIMDASVATATANHEFGPIFLDIIRSTRIP